MSAPRLFTDEDVYAAWIAEARRHAGIVVSNQRPIGHLLRRILHLAGTLDADASKTGSNT